jgi:hypothetical protein
MLGASFAAIGILYVMPESVTNWNKSDIKFSRLFQNWHKHVKEGPVKDKDDWFLNWITHPYSGALYYMAGRSAGASSPSSFLVSTIMSTFFWEYGIEAFAEVPSIQDLIITPVVGSILGECFYLMKRNIVMNNNQTLLGSKFLGKAVLILMDPITEVSNLFIGKKKNDVLGLGYPTYQRKHFGYQVRFIKKF